MDLTQEEQTGNRVAISKRASTKSVEGYEDASSLLKMQYESVKLKLATKHEALI